MLECPYCGREYVNETGMFSHALDKHRQAVLAYWLNEYGFSPRRTAQQPLTEVIA